MRWLICGLAMAMVVLGGLQRATAVVAGSLDPAAAQVWLQAGAVDNPPQDDAGEDSIDLGSDDEDAEAIAIEDDAATEDEGGEIDLGQADVQGQAVQVVAAPPAAVTEVITDEQIASSGAASIDELLSRSAGFTVNDTFAGSEVTFQGLPSKFTTVLIDGQRVPGHIFERVDFSQLPVQNLERVEIIRGPQAAAYGSDSAGVVVNLVTKQGAGTVGSLTLGIGSLGYNNQHLLLSGSSGPHAWLFGAERSLRESYDLSHFAPDTDGDSFRRYDLLGKYQWRGGPHKFSLQLDSFNENAVGRSFAPPDQIRMNETFTRRFQGTLQYDRDLGHGRSLALTHNYGTYYHDLHRYYVGYEDSSAVDSGFRDELQDTHLKYQQYGKDYLLAAGVERNWDRLRSDRIGNAGTAEAKVLAGFATLEFYATPRWTLSGALRYDDHSIFGPKLSPKASAAYKLTPVSSLTFAAGRGLRNPSLRERYYEFASPFGYTVIGNPELQPETDTSYNLDYERTVAHGYLRAGLFQHDISNMIVFSQIQASPQVFQTQNTGAAHTAGAQLSLERRYALGCPECSTQQVGWGYDATWIADSEDSELGTRLVNSPEWDHRLRLFYNQPRLDTELLVKRSDSRYLDRENNTRAPGFTTVDLTLGGPLGDGTWRVAGLNLFNERDGRYGPEPGRELRFEYTLAF